MRIPRHMVDFPASEVRVFRFPKGPLSLGDQPAAARVGAFELAIRILTGTFNQCIVNPFWARQTTSGDVLTLFR
ncbi:hypothetical protein MPC4_310011 [Methylocella tundrae]|uniref:Uncharacterized protein n=1 Tax=Methylocella tundrae TaxID=227605 RepID=A0A8B6M8D8_METTU|nr:hypothetical protein MPC1_1050003 [Methylocella tundrae]VTZ51136.1 hypothetical protein MPC4_310011 [Methylocella tundrae]